MGAKWLLLWGAPAPARGTAGGGAGGGGATTAVMATPAATAPDAFEAACAAAARATGGPPTGAWSARMTLLRAGGTGGGAGVDAVAVSAAAPPGKALHPTPARPSAAAARPGPPPAPSLPAGPARPVTHVVWPACRRVLAGGPGLVPLLAKTGGYEQRGRLEVGGPEFGAAGTAVVRVGRVVAGHGGTAAASAATGGGLRGIVLEVELADVDDLAEAAPALAELTGRLRSAAAAAGTAVAAAASPFTLTPLAAPVSEYDLPRGWGPAHGAVQLAALAGAVLGKGVSGGA